jgi:hypothetical protein
MIGINTAIYSQSGEAMLLLALNQASRLTAVMCAFGGASV